MSGDVPSEADIEMIAETLEDRRLPVSAKAVRRLASRCAELEAALRPFAEKWDLHAAAYLSFPNDGREFRVFGAGVVGEMLGDIERARATLAPTVEPQHVCARCGEINTTCDECAATEVETDAATIADTVHRKDGSAIYLFDDGTYAEFGRTPVVEEGEAE